MNKFSEILKLLTMNKHSKNPKVNPSIAFDFRRRSLRSEPFQPSSWLPRGSGRAREREDVRSIH